MYTEWRDRRSHQQALHPSTSDTDGTGPHASWLLLRLEGTWLGLMYQGEMENWKEKKARERGGQHLLHPESPNHSLHQLSGEELEGVMATPEIA